MSTTLQVLDMAKTLLDSAAAKIDPMNDLRSKLSTGLGTIQKALVLKVEAMLVQAFKTSSKSSQRELVTGQMSMVAGHESIQESDIEPVLLAWSKSILT